MFETKITKLFGIKYPIIQGGMVHLSREELTAAVSNAGGLGIIASVNFATKEDFRTALKRVKKLTNKPFGVNINLSPSTRPVNNEEYIAILIEEGVKIVETSGRSPVNLMKQLKDGGVKVIHKAPGGVRFAKTAEEIGCDAVAIIGYECGGHPGPDDVGSLVLIRAAAEQVKIPIIAGGGIGDAAGMVAALSLGADAILMGTRFMATKECTAHPKFKEWLVKANENDVVVTQRSIKVPARSLKNGPSAKVIELEKQGAPLEELLKVTSGKLAEKVYFDGDLEAGMAECGQVVGLIHDIPTCKELIDRMVKDAQEIIWSKLYPMVNTR
ncbi:MAG: nitronate monooxygenase [Dehalococcoidales bacterium]|nr:nitronate monooxygenase [Dehalococcoidales bacterium]